MFEPTLRPPSSVAQPRSSVKRILVIEDDKDFRIFVSRALNRPTFDVIQAAGGSEGLAIARRSPPDLVLLDLAMPGINGLETCRRLRAIPQTSRVPILVMTAMPNMARVLHTAADAVAADGFLTKPFLRSELLAEVERLLQAAPVPERPTPASAAPTVLTRGNLRVDLSTHRVWAGAREIKSLAPKRFRLLVSLLRRPEGVSREQLLTEVWDGLGHFDRSAKTVDIMVLRLRGDLSVHGHNPIVAIPGGYKLVG